MVQLSDDANEYVIADAVYIERLGNAVPGLQFETQRPESTGVSERPPPMNGSRPWSRSLFSESDGDRDEYHSGSRARREPWLAEFDAYYESLGRTE